MERKIVREIENESPEIHWGFLPVENKVVLDLGCGINSEFAPTPWYFIQEKGAKMVYGVDPSKESYEWFKQNYNIQKFLPINDYVDSLDKHEFYLRATNPDVIKCDIEGSEIFMMAIKPELLVNVKNIAVEYHNLACLISVERMFEENGFEMEYFRFSHLDITHQGVIHGFRKPKVVTKLRQTQNPEELLNQQLKDWNGGHPLNQD